MNLANDILIRANGNSLIRAESNKPTRKYIKTRAPKPGAKATKKHSVPGAAYLKNRDVYRAFFYDGVNTTFLGEHTTAERAQIAVRLYKLWRKRKYEVIPHTTEKRLYRRRNSPNY